MVRKGIVKSRVKRGVIPSKNPQNDRARTVSQLFKIFRTYLPHNKRSKTINFSRQILEIGESDAIFSGKDPYISGIAVFVYSCRKFSINGRCPVTYDQIRNELGHFASGRNFLMLLEQLSKKFP